MSHPKNPAANQKDRPTITKKTIHPNTSILRPHPKEVSGGPAISRDSTSRVLPIHPSREPPHWVMSLGGINTDIADLHSISENAANFDGVAVDHPDDLDFG